MNTAIVYGLDNAVKLFSFLDKAGITASIETMEQGAVRYKITALCSSDLFHAYALNCDVAVETASFLKFS